jgi:hypothetical protein
MALPAALAALLVAVVLGAVFPASGWEMIAKVRRLFTSVWSRCLESLMFGECSFRRAR